MVYVGTTENSALNFINVHHVVNKIKAMSWWKTEYRDPQGDTGLSAACIVSPFHEGPRVRVCFLINYLRVRIGVYILKSAEICEFFLPFQAGKLCKFLADFVHKTSLLHRCICVHSTHKEETCFCLCTK